MRHLRNEILQTNHIHSAQSEHRTIIAIAKSILGSRVNVLKNRERLVVIHNFCVRNKNR